MDALQKNSLRRPQPSNRERNIENLLSKDSDFCGWVFPLPKNFLKLQQVI
jgi:hypothetical protein